MKDLKIYVEPALAKQVAQIICHEIKNSKSSSNNRRVYDLAHRCEKQYNQITKWMELGRTCHKFL